MVALVGHDEEAAVALTALHLGGEGETGRGIGCTAGTGLPRRPACNGVERRYAPSYLTAVLPRHCLALLFPLLSPACTWGSWAQGWPVLPACPCSLLPSLQPFFLTCPPPAPSHGRPNALSCQPALP